MSESKKQIFLLGYSGHSYVVADAIASNGDQISGYFEKEAAVNNPYKLTYYGFEQSVDIKAIVQNNVVFPAIGDNNIRRKLVSFIRAKELTEYIVTANSAVISGTATIATSSFIAPNAAINALARIGCGCIINTAAVIEHECIIGDFAHIAPGAVLAGNVTVGEGSFIGANAVIKQGVKIGRNVIIGAGTVVIADIPENGLWVGNPARRIK